MRDLIWKDHENGWNTERISLYLYTRREKKRQKEHSSETSTYLPVGLVERGTVVEDVIRAGRVTGLGGARGRLTGPTGLVPNGSRPVTAESRILVWRIRERVNKKQTTALVRKTDLYKWENTVTSDEALPRGDQARKKRCRERLKRRKKMILKSEDMKKSKRLLTRMVVWSLKNVKGSHEVEGKLP